MIGKLASRRSFLKTATAATAASLLPAGCKAPNPPPRASSEEQASAPADYTLRIAATPLEIASDRIISVATYNGQFPGPLLRFKEGKQVTVAVYNDSDTPEQLHWHGQMLPSDVDGSAEEGTPFIPAHGMRRITFTPRPAGLRFYHTHLRAGADLSAGQYSGQVGPVYIEAPNEPGNFDREVFLVLKEFEPTLSRGGDMAQDFLAPSAVNPELKNRGEASMKASLAKGMPHGFEVGYGSFTINGRMLGHGEPIRVKQGERVLLHVVNGSATEIRSLALPGHLFRVIAMDGNPVPSPTDVSVLWIGTAERISAIVEMNHPGVWILGDLADDDRQARHGHRCGVRRSQRQAALGPATTFPVGLCRLRKAENLPACSRRDLRDGVCKRERGGCGIQSLDDQRSRLSRFANDGAAFTPSETRVPLPHQDAQCQ